MSLSRLRIAFFAGVSLILAACFPTSEHKIATDRPATLPPEFTGIWVGTLGDGPATLMFMEPTRSQQDAMTVSALVIRQDEDRPSLNAGWLETTLHVARIRDEVFLSAILEQMDGEPTEAEERGYYPLRVVFNDEGFAIFAMDRMITAELVDRGALDGRVKRDQSLPMVRLSNDGLDFAGFLRNADLDEVFAEPFAEFSRAD